ncbi:MAG: DUF389 domain-containing protein [Myxacorys chilensis ATA2-1-KO14]|jgi:uncharacterized hydrophobic protein (TIGR00271 family)|nr:DUF389 domain-containing protein [Myxacorys chilensis ATA2-1-KO14]
MRQLLVQVPRGHGKEVLNTAKDHDGTNLALFEAIGTDELLDVVIIHIPNRKVEDLMQALEGLPNLRITLNPHGVMGLKPPADEAAQQVTDVAPRSPIEVFLSGLQSVGSWKGFLGYAAAAGVVVWIGLFTNTNYLLVAAMLIAPFAGPAMNVALATARGDRRLLGRSLLRYFAALAVAIAVAGLLTLVLRQETVTEQMAATSTVSAVAVLLPVVAGAAGALNLVQSQRSSLVSGAATGMLVAASLAPPAGLIGMAGAMGRWDLTVNGAFVLLLQLVGINLSAAIVFRLYGISAKGARYQRGKAWAFPAILAVTVAALAGLLTWQFSSSPNLQRSSRTQRATAEIQKVVDQSGLATLVESNVRFTRPDIQGQNTMLGTVYVQQRRGIEQSTEAIRTQLTQDIQMHLLNQGFNVTPLIDVSVLEAPNRS